MGMINRTVQSRDLKILTVLYKNPVSSVFCASLRIIARTKSCSSPYNIATLISYTVSEPSDMNEDSTELWPLEECRQHVDLIKTYQIMHDVSAIPPKVFFTFTSDQCINGHLLNLVKYHSIRDVQWFFWTEWNANDWNSLDQSTVTASSLNSFKHQLAQIILTRWN
jgi:hypothetical protein